jgi:hypothetical protein
MPISMATRSMLKSYRAENYARGGMVEDLINNLMHDLKKCSQEREALQQFYNTTILLHGIKGDNHV